MSQVFDFIPLEGKPSPLHTLQGQLFLVECLWTGIAGLTAEKCKDQKFFVEWHAYGNTCEHRKRCHEPTNVIINRYLSFQKCPCLLNGV